MAMLLRWGDVMVMRRRGYDLFFWWVEAQGVDVDTLIIMKTDPAMVVVRLFNFKS